MSADNLGGKELRRRAEETARSRGIDATTQATHDLQRLVHELQVHQIELEMQNEALRCAQVDTERACEQYSELFEKAPSGYLRVDDSGEIVQCNAAVCSMLRCSQGQLVDQPLEQVVAKRERPRLRQHLEYARQAGRADCELEIDVSGAAPSLVRFDTSPIPSRPGECLVVLTDMSERQRHQAALESSNRELESRVAARTAELESQNNQLHAEMAARAISEAQGRELESRLRESQRLQSLGMLAAGIAHDFNNLLVGVVGNAELLAREPNLPAGWSESLGMIQRTGQDASELTRQLLVFAGRGQMEASAIRLPEIVAECLELLRPRLGSQIQLQTQCASELAPMLGDRSQVQRMVMNLLTNAIEALDGRGAIEVRATAEQLDAGALAAFQYADAALPGAYIVLHITDTGCGIEAAAATRIFEPFFSTKFTGRGLGLATVLGIVQSHAGAIRVDSRRGEGTRFDVAFPQAKTLPTSQLPARRANDTRPASGSVLLIDDDDNVRQVVSRLLQALGFSVTAANGGDAGLKLFQDTRPSFDLVVLDWLMPNMAGEDVLKELRRRAPELPVIVMSGYSAEALASEDERVARLQKPMTLSQLQAAVRNVVGSASNLLSALPRR